MRAPLLHILSVRSRRTQNKWLAVVSISIQRTSWPTGTLSTCGPFQLFSPHLPLLNFSSSWTSLPPAPDSYITLTFQPCALSLMVSFAHTLPSLLAFPHLLSWPSPVCWPWSVYFFLYLLWTLPDALAPHFLISTIKTSSTIPWSGHVFTLYTEKLSP